MTRRQRQTRRPLRRIHRTITARIRSRRITRLAALALLASAATLVACGRSGSSDSGALGTSPIPPSVLVRVGGLATQPERVALCLSFAVAPKVVVTPAGCVAGAKPSEVTVSVSTHRAYRVARIVPTTFPAGTRGHRFALLSLIERFPPSVIHRLPRHNAAEAGALALKRLGLD